MKLRKLKLHNFRLFKEFELSIPDSNLIAIIGNNGAGKTTILDAIALCYMHFTGKLLSKTERHNIETWFALEDIALGETSATCTIQFEYAYPNAGTKSISITKRTNEPGFKFEFGPKNFADSIKGILRNDTLRSIPIVAYYNVYRTSFVNNKDSKETKSESVTYNEKLLAYERALNLYAPKFDTFEEWFIRQSIAENVLKVSKGNLKEQLPALRNVKAAVGRFFEVIDPGRIAELNIKTEDDTKTDFSQEVNFFVVFQKGEAALKYRQLSNGEKMVVGLVCEIARRLTIANENSDSALKGSGIVLIDELELHLHPNWQRKIGAALTTTFPNVQFIFTTHSPLILSGLHRESILVLSSGGIVPNEELPDIYSATSDEILERLMMSEISSEPFTAERDEIDRLFNSMRFDEAEQKLKALKRKVRANPQWLVDYQQRIEFAKS